MRYFFTYMGACCFVLGPYCSKKAKIFSLSEAKICCEVTKINDIWLFLQQNTTCGLQIWKWTKSILHLPRASTRIYIWVIFILYNIKREAPYCVRVCLSPLSFEGVRHLLFEFFQNFLHCSSNFSSPYVFLWFWWFQMLLKKVKSAMKRLWNTNSTDFCVRGMKPAASASSFQIFYNIENFVTPL